MVIAGYDISRTINQILLKIPLDLSGKGALLRQIVIERMLILTLDADLAE
jgi:hypothetical protein